MQTFYRSCPRMLTCTLSVLLAALTVVGGPRQATAAKPNPQVQRAIDRGLDWLADTQSRLGHWSTQNGQFPTAMTALAGMAMLCEGSTTSQGKYAPNISRAVDYIVSRARPNGLIGDPHNDDRYTYGHGYGMLFLSQVLGEEEDAERRETLVKVLTNAVRFTGEAQNHSGGWGYVSAKDVDFDEGSTTITQVQALRGCRNAGIPAQKSIVDKAVQYIKNSTLPQGSVQYSSQGGGGRPAITAAAVACLFSAGEYDSEYVPKLLKYCRGELDDLQNDAMGHWHYAHYYYAQVKYREGGEEWQTYRDRIYTRLVSEAQGDGSWAHPMFGPVYATCFNLTILQLDKGALPIYQR